MSPDHTEQLLALARWHTSRRAVDELVAPMLEIGPVAVDRVSDQLAALQQLLRDEQAAFDAFAALVGERSRSDAVVVDLFSRVTPAD